MKEIINSMATKEAVIAMCLAYSAISLVVFWIAAYRQSKDKTAAKQVVTDATKGVTTDSPSEVLEKAAKLVDAFSKAGPAIASLGASIAALGFAAYIVAQPLKDQDNTKTGTDNSSQGTTPPGKKSGGG